MKKIHMEDEKFFVGDKQPSPYEQEHGYFPHNGTQMPVPRKRERIRPCRGLVLVKRVEVEEKIRGIIAPPEVIDKWTAQQQVVVAVGKPQLFEEIPDRLFSKKWKQVQVGRKTYYQRDEPAPVKRGDWILIYPRTLCPTGERDLFMVTFDNVMGIFNEHDSR